MVTLKSIQEFVENGEFAVVGASRNSRKFGYMLIRELHKKNIPVYPVNPLASEILGLTCYKEIKDLPPHVKAIIFVTKPEITEKLVPEAIQKGIKHIWLQKGAESISAIEYAEINKVNIIYRHCILMFLKPSAWIHSVHRFVKKATGSLPK